jgi:thiol:disulfide interchange protein
MTRRALILWSLILLACFPVGWIIGQLPSGRARTPARAATVELSQWTTYDQALAESRQNGKPVMLDFNAEWCGPCRMLKQRVFEASVPGDMVQSAVIPVSVVDRHREDGRNSQETEGLQRQYRIQAFPTLVVFSPRTGKSTQMRGYRGVEWTVAWIRTAARAVR